MRACARASYSSAEPSHQWMASGWVSLAISPTQSRSFAWVVGASAAMVWLGMRGTLLVGTAVLGGAGIAALRDAEVDEREVRILVADLERRPLGFPAGQRQGADEGRAGLHLDVRGAVGGLHLHPLLFLEFGFELFLGLGAVDHGFPAAHRHERGQGDGEEGEEAEAAHEPGVSRKGPLSRRKGRSWG